MAERKVVIQNYQRQRGVRVSQIEPARSAGCGCDLRMGASHDRHAMLLRVHQAQAPKIEVELTLPPIADNTQTNQAEPIEVLDARIATGQLWQVLAQRGYPLTLGDGIKAHAQDGALRIFVHNNTGRVISETRVVFTLVRVA